MLVNHDYSKSPAMEAIDEDEDVEIERELMMETNQIGASDQKSTSPMEKQEQIESNLPAKTEESNGSKPGTTVLLYMGNFVSYMANNVECKITCKAWLDLSSSFQARLTESQSFKKLLKLLKEYCNSSNSTT